MQSALPKRQALRASSVPGTCRSRRAPRAWSCIPGALRSRLPSRGSIRRRAIISATRSTSSTNPCDASVAMAPPPDCAGEGGARGLVVVSGLGMGAAAPRSHNRRPRIGDRAHREGARAHRRLGCARHLTLCDARRARGARHDRLSGSRSGGLGGSLLVGWRFAYVAGSDALFPQRDDRLRARRRLSRGPWRLLGAIEAVNGLILFGLTTAFLYAAIHEAWPLRRG